MPATPATPTAARPAAGLPRWRVRLRFLRANWLISTLALVLLPKCGICLLAYVAAGAGLAAAGRELCGVEETATGVAGAPWLVFSLCALGLIFLARRHWPGKRTREKAAAGGTADPAAER